MDTATTVTDLLQTTGGWGLSVILGYVIYRLYTDRLAEQKEIHKEYVAVLKETTAALESVKNHMEKCYIARRDDNVFND